MDEQSGETEEDEVIGDGISELEMEKLVPEWGWQRDKGSWFKRHGEIPEMQLGANSFGSPPSSHHFYMRWPSCQIKNNRPNLSWAALSYQVLI